jgi:hypothetical protein
MEHSKDWNELAREDMAFALGDQWTAEERTTLKEQARPALTFNRIRSIIHLVSGYQRENASRIKVNPEGGEDRIFSEVLDRTIKQIDKWAHLTYKFAYWFDDGCYTGKGWLEAVLTYDADPIRGELRFPQRSPYQVLVDPDHNEYDLNEWPGAQYVFKVVRLSREQLKALYPTKAKLITGFVMDADTDDARLLNGSALLSEGDQDDYGNRPNRTTVLRRNGGTAPESDLPQDDKFTVKEYWHPKQVKKYFVIDKESGEPRRFDTTDEAEAFIREQAFGKVVERTVREMWVGALVGGYVVQDERSPFEPYYSGFPFFRFLADWAPSAESEEQRVQGLVRPLKDPQREKNKSKSQTLHILNTQANSGWVADDTAMSPEGFKLLEEMGSKPGVVVKKRPGTELREILPKGPNAGHLQREEQADEEFKQISGITPDLMGFQEGTQSGRAISMRIKQAILSLVRIFNNYRYSKEIVGKFILDMVPALFDVKKLTKVLGPDYMRKALDPERYPEGLTEGHLAAFLQIIADNKYDVYVSEADQNATIRYEIFQELTELLKAGAPIPLELIIEYLDLPNSEEVKQKIKEQQMMQMQQEAAMSAAKGAGRPAPKGA